LRNLAFEDWDRGRLRVNSAFAGLLRAHGLTTFDSLMHFADVEVAKDLRRERVTARIVLKDAAGAHGFYIKRHGPPPWKEYIKPLLHLQWPLLGARHEWNAILRFHEADIPTMTPVAFGESGRYSFLVTEALDGCQKLSEWMQQHLRPGDGVDRPETRQLVAAVAQVARTMHRAGMHHQDFYAGHLMLPAESPDVHVIDLGRVRERRRLGKRWIIKDLAQLDYSARFFSQGDRLRFLRAYLGRPLEPRDRGLIRQVRSKAAAIARHSRKNRL
jgi:heptose I phosphotransferase